MQNTVFHPALPFLLVALFTTFIGLAATAIWFTRSARARMIPAPFVLCWLTWSPLIGSLSIDLYGAVRSISVAAIAVAAGLVTVHAVALLGERSSAMAVPSHPLTVAKALVAGLLGTVVVPVLILMLVVFLGIDGP